MAYEILIVDNGSTDSTSKVIRKYVDGVRVRSIFEPVVGLSRSRNTGWRAAKGQYVGYIDDDAVAGTEWVENAISVSKTVKPYPDIIGGPIFLEWEAPPPDWIDENLMRPLGYVYWGDAPHRLTPVQRLGGGNSIYRRERLIELEGFDERLGRKGAGLLSGEETQLQKRIENENGLLYYHPGIHIWHFVPKERMRPLWFYRRSFWEGKTDNILLRTLDPEITDKDYGRNFSLQLPASEKNHRMDQVARLLKNALFALGCFSSRRQTVHGRIYLAYVWGWLISMLSGDS